MVIELTNKVNGKKILVNSAQVKLWEPDDDGNSTHVVFGADLVRVVVESSVQIKNVLGAVAPAPQG